MFNEFWFRRSPAHRRGEERRLTSFFHPLDSIGAWNRFYGPRGFVQYQFVVPDECAEVVVEVIERLSSSKVPSFFAVLKRFGPQNPGLLSFPREGFTLALDMPVGPSALPQVLDDLDAMVGAAQGRVYLAKDARLDAATAAAMYPRLDQFRAVKRRVDPDGLLTSDLARRLELSER
jgi:decaprenylphospho-beta-D-ribofuranose 2-oxidase